MIVKMKKMFVLCFVRNAQSQFAGSAMIVYCAECIGPHTCGDEVVHVAP